jgi:hypothetical protein
VFAGTPCSPYSIARGGAACPPLHTADGPVEPCPAGWIEYRATHDDLILFTCDVFRAAHSTGAACMLENPANVAAPGPAHWAAKAHHGSIFRTHAVRDLCAGVQMGSVDFAQCAFGGTYRKWTTILYSAALDAHIRSWRNFGCAHGFGKHDDIAYGRDELGAAKAARAAAYPQAMNQAIAAVAAAFVAARDAPAGLPGVGRVADGPALSLAVRAACAAAAAHPPRFSSLRNLRPASDSELRRDALPTLSPPSPPVPRRTAPLANGWPPGWEARRPVAIEQLYKPGVYAELELWLEDAETEMLRAAAASGAHREAQAPPPTGSQASPSAPRSTFQGRTYTIPISSMADGAELCTWDSSDRDDCVPVTPSTADTVFPGGKQMDRGQLQLMADALGWSDLDIIDQACGGGLEARTGCPRDTVVSRHHPGLFANYAAAASTIASDISEGWVRPPARKKGARVGHLPYVPCHADPRDVIMRLLSKVVEAEDGSTTLEDYLKARVSTNLSHGVERAVNAGCAKHDTEVALPTVPEIARAAAICDAACVEQGEPRRPLPIRQDHPADPAAERGPAAASVPAQARSGFYAIDLASAYRYVCIQLLDLWCHTFLWLDSEERIGICVDTRLCFGGAYGPNRFERITTLVGAYILLKQEAYDLLHPYPEPIPQWAAERSAMQQRGVLPQGREQLSPKGLRVYLDDFSGIGLMHPAPDPVGYTILVPDARAMRALGLVPAPIGCRLIGHASIAAGELGTAGFGVAAPKTMIGTSVITLGLQPDVLDDSVTCPSSKRRLLLAQISDTQRAIAEHDSVERKPVERLTGRLCNISQVLPEIGAELHGGYAVANARTRARGAAGNRQLLSFVPLPPASRVRHALLRLCRVAAEVLGENAGVALAPARRFQSPGDDGVLTVTGDASGDIAGGDAGTGGFAFHPSQPLTIYVVSELWPADIAAALTESALEPHLRTGVPRFSMPAAELFTSWAVMEAALEAGAPRRSTSAVIAIGDCQPAAGALNRASSPVGLIQDLLRHARADVTQWLGVQVPRELNLDADVLSHPSRLRDVLDTIQHPYRHHLAPIPERCWAALRAAVAASDPLDSDH